ncbi:twin-arginine translocase subunit TatB [Lysobacteraceae bacterium NML71-0210]|nr:twin-arginine translocase subunit TatB [Xanthomonadaceae bacterium NML71-0210]
MFEVSFPELIILAVIVLLVLGPERLSRAARFAGLWVRRARAHWHKLRSEFEEELHLEEMRRNMEATRKALAQMEAEARQLEAETAAKAAAGESQSADGGERR